MWAAIIPVAAKILGGIGSTALLAFIKTMGLSAMEKYLGYLKEKAETQTERERIQMQGVIKGLEVEIEARRNARDIRIATAAFWEMRLITTAIALPFVWHLWMVFLDTAFGFYQDNCWYQAGRQVCGVKAFPPPFNEWEGAILLSFFGVQAGISVAQSVATAFIKRGKGV